MLKKLFVVIALSYITSAIAGHVSSEYAMVVDENSGKVLFEKNSDTPVPIASLTKLMTAMVILDSKPDMNALIDIEPCDVDTLKHSTSYVPVGTTLPRKSILQLALMSSDNRAAAALARTYPGGNKAFVTAVYAKLVTLGMDHTVLVEPTGLSPNNMATASDLVKMAEAAAKYPDIVRITTNQNDLININGRYIQYHNTNRLVGQKGWQILLSKTGYTSEAGRCLIMCVGSNRRNRHKHLQIILSLSPKVLASYSASIFFISWFPSRSQSA